LLADLERGHDLVLDVFKRPQSRAELEHNAAERPDVCLEAEATVELLWGHVPKSALGSSLSCLCLIQPIGDSQVDELDLFVVTAKQDVLGFQILMNDLAAVQVAETRDKLGAD